ncbi:cytochrome P450 [Leptolyngbya cf. ectocarpi LEGE 11479]|uniref:Cytochrome P450 n=1 Tax=Leptolyngbya cf. ectocarpi LEGE 11479 TaxID=1828722 RepID=A0A928ZTI3_LEPEC|nr:cytochrome P450 [Leptolyngbya ectocarpi]MBE9065624.1 cytochrome P450 [Leptolyngbya cf. ectocarpi LEGE 11479]
MDITTFTQKVLKAHDSQVKLSRRLAKVGYDSTLGKLLRLKPYYSEGFTILKAWRDFLYIRKEQIGNTFFAVDHAIMHADHAQVKKLMQIEPQVRGNDLGIIRILAPGYMLNNPLSLGMNGKDHTGIRAIFQQALPDPFTEADGLGDYVDKFLSTAAKQGNLHIGDDLPRFMVKILHHLVFQISLSEDEVTASRGYIKGLPLATLPTFISRYLLAFKTGPIIKHRQHLIQRYKTASNWAAYVETGKQYGLSPDQVANGLFDMIHIAGTAGTSALMGSVIGVLCLNDDLKVDVVNEINTVWPDTASLTGDSLRQATLLHKVILETARMYPPVRFVSQLATESGEVEIGSQKCPFQKGTRLLGSIFTANRDGNRYDKPDEFSVQRDFSDLLSWNGDAHERVCPGKSLSIELIKVFCMYLFKQYQWQQFTEVKWDFENVTAVTPNELELQGFAAKA